MEMVKLRTGYEVSRHTVLTTRISISGLFKRGIVGITSLYDLHHIAKDPEYVEKVFDGNLQLLRDFALIDDGNKMHEDVRQSVLAIIDGEGLDIKIVHPLADDNI